MGSHREETVYGYFITLLGCLCVALRAGYNDVVCTALLVLSIILTIYKISTEGFSEKNGTVKLMLAALLLYAVIGVIGGNLSVISILPVPKILLAADMLILIERKEAERFIKGIWIGCIAVCIAGLAAYIGLISIPGSVLYDNGIYRLQSVIQYANTTALFMAVGYMITVYYRIKTKKTGLFILEAMFATALLLTFSKMMTAVFIVSLAAWGIIFKKRGVIISAVFILTAFTVLLAYNGGIGNTESSSFISRFVYMKDAVSAIGKNPVWGLGSGMWRYKQFAYQSMPYDVSYVHNGILQIAVDAGVVPACLFVVSTAAYIIKTVKRLKETKNETGILLITLFIMILIHSLVDIDMSFGAVPALLAVCVSASQKETEKKHLFVLSPGKTALRATAAVTAFCIALPAYAEPKYLSNGSYVEFGSIHGKPILWRVISHDKNGFLLYSEAAAEEKAFDAATDTVREDVYRKTHGSNYWGGSALRDWLNSEDEKVSFTNAVPDAAHILDGRNDYHSESGFLYEFTPAEKEYISEVENKSYLSYIDCYEISGGSSVIETGADIEDPGNSESAFYRNVSDKVFILDKKTLYDKVIKSGIGIKQDVWTRTPEGDNSANVIVCSNDGSYYTKGLNAYNTYVYAVPALYINMRRIASGSGTAEDPFRLDTGSEYSENEYFSCSADFSKGNSVVYDITNKTQNKLPLQVIAAVYKDDMLYSCYVDEPTVIDDKKRITIPVEIPQEGAYTTRLYVWNNVKDMVPLCGSATKNTD